MDTVLWLAVRELFSLFRRGHSHEFLMGFIQESVPAPVTVNGFHTDWIAKVFCEVCAKSGDRGRDAIKCPCPPGSC